MMTRGTSREHPVGWRAFVLPDRGGDNSEPPFDDAAWSWIVRALHAVFAIMSVLAVVVIASEHVDEGWAAPAAYCAVGALVIGYVLFGAAAIDRIADRRALVYLCVLIVTMGVLSRAAPDTLFLFFIAYPQVWVIVERPRPGIFWTVLLVAVSSVGVGLRVAHAGGSITSALVNQAIGVLFSLLLGVFNAQLIDQSRKQGDLIAALRRRDAELADARHAQGVLAERERVAREVHDTLAQGYTSIVMLARTATGALDRDPDISRERLAVIEEVAADNLREARAVVAGLAPTDLEGRTLRDALIRLTDRFTRETGVPVELTVDADLTGLAQDEQVVLLRAAQEALSNARRHARARRVTVCLERAAADALDHRLTGGDTVRLLVEDDGVGFDVDAARGHGLTGLRGRLEQAGGWFDVFSRPGAGTRVVVAVAAP